MISLHHFSQQFIIMYYAIYRPILIDSNTSITPPTTDTDFDPIAFLNQHYETEHQLITALPSLRTAISSRLTHLDDSLSTTLRHQAALAPMIAQDVMHARNAVLQLATRIKEVKDQAQKSEEAVLQITKDMKRLDYAKRHLQRTITALKRLHMLLHATEQLRVATVITERQVVPNYKVASHLIDATRLLLGHFEGYMGSVPKMRQVRDAVGVLRSQLRQGIVKLFDEVGFPEEHNQRVTSSDDFDENPEEGVSSSLGLTAGPPSALVQSPAPFDCRLDPFHGSLLISLRRRSICQFDPALKAEDTFAQAASEEGLKNSRGSSPL